MQTPVTDVGLPLALAIRIAVVTIAVLAGRRRRLTRRVAFVGAAVASIVTAATSVTVLYTGHAAHGAWLVHRASGLSLTYAVDGLSAWFLIVLSALAIPIAIFSIGYFAHPHFARRSAFVGAAFNVLLGAVETRVRRRATSSPSCSPGS